MILGNSVSATAGSDRVDRNGMIHDNQAFLAAANDLSNLSGTIVGTGVNGQVDLLAGHDP